MKYNIFQLQYNFKEDYLLKSMVCNRIDDIYLKIDVLYSHESHTDTYIPSLSDLTSRPAVSLKLF